MFSRLCRLCHRQVDNSVYNLRNYRISSTFSQQQNVAEKYLDVPEEKLIDPEKAMNSPEKESNVPENKEREPLIICKRPEFNFYKGKTFSKFETIPLASQGWHHLKSCGDYFTILPDYEDPGEDDDLHDDPRDFEHLGLHPKLVENLKSMNIHTPTEVQYLGIPKIMMNQHMVLSAETGCGKTIAYLLPLLNQIYQWQRLEINKERKFNEPFGLIITPSRELAEQIAREAKWLAKDLGIKITVKTGGRTKKILNNPPVGNVDLLIGSFGVISKLITTKIYKLHYMRHLVLDEAHALFDVTFDEKLRVFLHRMTFNVGDMANENGFPDYSQLTLVSATKAADFPDYLKGVIDERLFSDVTTSNFHRVMVPQKFLRVKSMDKSTTLLKLIKPRAVRKVPFIVFSNDSATCDWISLFLNEFGVNATHLNGEMPMVIRQGKFAAFQAGKFAVLSATNAGARGLDTIQVNNVINYDLPMSTADYIHRCGRTGRLGTKGECRVTNIITRHLEIELTQKIERAARRRRPLPIFDLIEEKEMKREKAEDMELLGQKNGKKPRGKNERDKRKKAPRKIQKKSRKL
ncbi:probable ATP-dependent RNA helicase DDX28 [Venturia canescens]|uniref:probable ATP-dependent RNA helicase DDX28 n=1 Tax=Venturia canescens TaxID=32260 RepID=UPI001C9C517D|nr:probable ATP-dependent RNA helicase DDX28 [Venturia canescens]XP_043269448.1 probable ATP-dependent RNA helicase DDX28 [Venturia canescens]